MIEDDQTRPPFPWIPAIGLAVAFGCLVWFIVKYLSLILAGH